MDDQQLWNVGITRLKELLAGLPVKEKSALLSLLARYGQIKESHAEVVAGIDAAPVCHDCGGRCCLNGKYRMNVFDAIAFVVRHIPPPVNFMQNPLCPYGSHEGCRVEPGLRPADCIMFICDALDEKFSPDSRMILATAEHELRECLAQASTLTGERLRTPLILWAETEKK